MRTQQAFDRWYHMCSDAQKSNSGQNSTNGGGPTRSLVTPFSDEAWAYPAQSGRGHDEPSYCPFGASGWPGTVGCC